MTVFKTSIINKDTDKNNVGQKKKKINFYLPILKEESIFNQNLKESNLGLSNSLY